MVEKTINNREENFVRALDVLENALPYAKNIYQSDVHEAAGWLMDQENGMEQLYALADRFEEAGIFDDGPWDELTNLQPKFVKGALMAGGTNATLEILSELRILSLAEEDHESEDMSSEEAQEFLNEVMALNMDLIFPEETEAMRIEGKEEEKDRIDRLFQFLNEKLSLTAVSDILVREIKELTAQRPIIIDRIASMIKSGKQLINAHIDDEDHKELERYIKALTAPSQQSKEHNDLTDYLNVIKKLGDKELKNEAEAFAKSMRETGLVSPHHAVLMRYLNHDKTDILPLALGLNDEGKAQIKEHDSIVGELIKVAIHPPMCQSVYGLALMLERGILSSNPVVPSLRRLIELDLQPDVRKMLLNVCKGNEGITANSILVSGVISVLGQPLGVGQGMNPTCQTARGISLWSLHAPGHLMEFIARAARDGDIDVMFEGQRIHSKNLHDGLVEELHKKLDPVSLILVPHLDRIYAELVNRAQFRGEDVHKWVNPAFYGGDWIPKGFSSAIDELTRSIADFPGFVRLFYATHHPEHNNGHGLIYPNPVGIFVTNPSGNLLGLHAVSIQRIDKDPDDQYRIYFYNPNNDSSQDWGQDVKPSVRGNGEKPGESSLPFHKFVARLYAFHYNQYEQGDAYSIDNDIVDEVTSLAKESWGKKYTWIDQ